MPSEDIAGLSRLATGFRFTEGPVWHPAGYLLLSDVEANQIIQLWPDGRAELFKDTIGFTGADASMLSHMPGPDGLALDAAGALIICQHGDHAIARLDTHGGLTVITGQYEGRPFNSPNDLAIRRDGSIYFTDPPYGLKDQLLHPSVFQTAAGVYCYKDGQTRQLSTTLRYPNGICFSADEKLLFVSSNHPDEPYLLSYEVMADGGLQHPSVLLQQNADGIKAGADGALYLATTDGILKVSAAGKRLALAHVPETPTNMAFGGQDKDLLYITAGSSVYMLPAF